MAKAHRLTRPTERKSPVKRHAPVTIADREDAVPQKAKKAVSVNAMFERARAQEMQKKQAKGATADNRSLLRPKAAGITKQEAKPGFFTNPSHKSHERVADPNFLKNCHDYARATELDSVFSGILQSYGTNAAAAQRKENVNRRQVLDNRRQGLNKDGEPVKPQVPTWEEIQELENKIQSLSDNFLGDLGQELMTVLITQKDGTSITKNVKFEDTLKEFFERYERKSTKVSALEGQLESIGSEIEILTIDLTGESDEVKEANAQHEAEMKGLKEELDGVEKKAAADTAAIRGEEEASRKTLSKKIKKIMAELA